jgi:hypothetical protein
VDYPLENLGPERFQQFCQALLLRDQPDVQCFPVAQPDGGRDAVSFYPEGQSGKFAVFQVKFSRKPLAEADPHEWLVGIITAEAPKLRALIPKGASRYYLITNIPGTAHLDAGAIDKLNQTLTDSLTIPSRCWWRDDICRRLDDAWSLKWVYPELMTGPDFLRAIIDSGLSEHRDRRSATVKAFLRHQYELDEEVRFKQVELQNKLLDLFIDVPISFRGDPSDQKHLHLYHSIFSMLPRVSSDPDPTDPASETFRYRSGARWIYHSEEPIGGATLLLHPLFQAVLPNVVLEGAPGQGKSTIVQYVCQVHRMRLLQEKAALSTLPQEHRDVPSRLPIKVDLRDLATWLSKRHPFSIDGPEEVPAGWHKSLESFLAALISNQSGGTQFNTDDLIAVMRISSVLLVLDGLDEVADIAKRREVVEEIVNGVQRLEENAASLQTVITSRPAAFANSPGMPRGKYPYLQLLPLTPRLINKYGERWLKARHLDHKQSAEFRKVLKTKIEQPHLRDLARNPMQLAIVLSLILTRGASLPDKRTALYDSYVDLFISRESEKSTVVRDHRELLIDIHRYLAWVLHSEAELGHSSASITEDRLQKVLSEYLTHEGHDPELAKELFTGMVERVVALVSRIQGKFEFEVQPLREYFAGRFLYDTAPYSPPGGERRGTKPDRFDAIARNFYWLNVTRFYAGCFSKGELPSLVERLEELGKDEGFRNIRHPRMLAATLLADWVFTQNPRSVQQVVDIVLNDHGIRYLIASLVRYRASGTGVNDIVLPPKCGRDELILRCFQILASEPPSDFEHGLLELLRLNATGTDLASSWLEWLGKQDQNDRGRWLGYGEELGVLSGISLPLLREVVVDAVPNTRVLASLYRARRLDYLEGQESTFEATVEAILSRFIFSIPHRLVESPLDALNHAVDPLRYSLAFRERQPIPLTHLLEQRRRPPLLHLDPVFARNTESYSGYEKCLDFAAVADEESKKTAAEWASEISPWNRVVESGRSLWGDRWAFYFLANVAAGIKSNAEQCSDCPDLLDHSRALCRRARHARLRSSSASWWMKQFSLAQSHSDQAFVLLVALTWINPSALLPNIEFLERIVNEMDRREWARLFFAARRAASLVHLRPIRDLVI